MAEISSQPGGGWLNVVTQPTLEAFSSAFSADPTLGRAYLDWEGVFQGEAVSGTTILAYDAARVIDRIRLSHYAHEQVHAFEAELMRRQALKTNLVNHSNGVHSS